MKIYRISQIAVTIDQKVKVVKDVFKQLEGILGVQAKPSTDGYLLDWSIEKAEDSLHGESYTQVYHNRFDEGFHVEIYYESEFMQEQFGRVTRVNCGYESADKCVRAIVKAIDGLTR